MPRYSSDGARTSSRPSSARINSRSQRRTSSRRCSARQVVRGAELLRVRLGGMIVLGRLHAAGSSLRTPVGLAPACLILAGACQPVAEGNALFLRTVCEPETVVGEAGRPSG